MIPASATYLAGSPRRDRAVVLSGIAAITALSWAYMFHLAREMDSMAICTMNMAAWTPLDYLLLFAMWAVMMVAMMAPSTAPMVLAFARVNRSRREQARPYVSTGVFFGGYIGAWTAFSLVATAAQAGLHAAALVSPMMASSNPVFGGALLITAGVFQWTPLKKACLRHCRSPLSFLLNEWRDGARGAFAMGLHHGSYCVVCCWLLMALLFVAGVMNLLWVAAIAAFVLLEKVAPRPLLVGRAAGTLLILWGILTVARLAD